MKKTLFSLVCFLFSTLAFADDSNSNFFDYLVKRKTITAQYRHQFFSVSDEHGNFDRFIRTPQLKLAIPVDIFGGIIVGTTKMKIENRDEVGGILKQPEFNISSPYLTFDSSYFNAGISISYIFPMGDKADLVNLNSSIGVAAPKINTGIGTISLTAGVDTTVYFKTYNRNATTGAISDAQVNMYNEHPTFGLGQNSNGETVAIVKSQKPDYEVDATLLKAQLDLDCGLYTSATLEYLLYTTPGFSIDLDGDKVTSYSAENTTKATWELGYKLTDNLTIANSLSFGFDNWFEKLPANWDISKSNTGNVKVSEVIGVQYTL